MQRLALIRHAKSDWSNPDLTDFDRPLNNRGKKAAPLMGHYLAENRFVPDCLISSPAKRARKTARLIADEIDIDKSAISYQQQIYHAKVTDLITLVKDFSGCAAPALIGHNPAISELGQWLCPAAPGWLKTCAVLILDLAIEDWSELHPACGTIVVYTYPKQLSKNS